MQLKGCLSKNEPIRPRDGAPLSVLAKMTIPAPSWEQPKFLLAPKSANTGFARCGSKPPDFQHNLGGVSFTEGRFS